MTNCQLRRRQTCSLVLRWEFGGIANHGGIYLAPPLTCGKIPVASKTVSLKRNKSPAFRWGIYAENPLSLAPEFQDTTRKEPDRVIDALHTQYAPARRYFV